MGDNPGFEGFESSTQNIHKSMWAGVYASGAVASDNAAMLSLLEDTPYASYATENQALILLTKATDNQPAGGDGVPDPVATTGVAGSPGHFHPTNAALVADLAAMNDGIVADPATQWTVGQYIVLADDSHAWYDSADWQEGEAPAVVPNIVGLTATAADAALVAAGLVKGTVTTASGVLNEVLSQGTAADTEVAGGTAVNYVKGNGA